MSTNLFEDSRVSEGTRGTGAHEIGETAKKDVPEQIKVSDLAPGDHPDAVDPGIGRTNDTNREGFNTTSTSSSHSREMSAQSPAEVKHNRSVLSAGSLIGDRVRNGAGDHLGSIEQIMIDLASGQVAYAVLSFGGFLGIGDKLFAVPWNALRLDEGEQEFVLDVDKQTLEKAPGFEKGDWPDMADPAFGRGIHSHYGQTPAAAATYVRETTDAGDYIGDNRQTNRSMEFEPTDAYRKSVT